MATLDEVASLHPARLDGESRAGEVALLVSSHLPAVGDIGGNEDTHGSLARCILKTLGEGVVNLALQTIEGISPVEGDLANHPRDGVALGLPLAQSNGEIQGVLPLALLDRVGDLGAELLDGRAPQIGEGDGVLVHLVLLSESADLTDTLRPLLGALARGGGRFGGDGAVNGLGRSGGAVPIGGRLGGVVCRCGGSPSTIRSPGRRSVGCGGALHFFVFLVVSWW